MAHQGGKMKAAKFTATITISNINIWNAEIFQRFPASAIENQFIDGGVPLRDE